MKPTSILKTLAIATLLASCSGTSSLNVPNVETGGFSKSRSTYTRPIVRQGGEPSPTARKIVAFVAKNKGKRVGDGECWALINLAYRSAGIRHKGGRVWGRRINWQREGVRPGDIIEFEYARYPYAYTDANHTSIIMKVVNQDSVLVAHQHWNGLYKVTMTTLPLTYLRSGKQTVYRYDS